MEINKVYIMHKTNCNEQTENLISTIKVGMCKYAQMAQIFFTESTYSTLNIHRDKIYLSYKLYTRCTMTKTV